ncbi:hypothetical protein [unidentified bacterial endosymbiont]|uniref:hypothetical protein n=1 Tax=unidentified bacterial endosymbiont TaxID=2355 RepID=UPI002646EC0F|nr:hypothetical protein [unidentified bacterial endosymbiont]
MSVWGKIEAFICLTNKPEALKLIQQICHPPAGTTREEVAGRFEQLRTLAYGGFKENVQSGWHGENHFCILDENSREMLSVTLDDAGKYTVKCQWDCETHPLIPDTDPGEEGASGMVRTELAATTTAPQVYEAVWSAWVKAAPAGESTDRAAAVQKMRNCLYNGRTELELKYLALTTLPDLLPQNLTELNTDYVPLNYLPALPEGLQWLDVSNNWLTSLPALPSGLNLLWCHKNELTSLPVLPSGLQVLWCLENHLTSLPALPEVLWMLEVSDNQLTRLPEGIARLSTGASVGLANNPLSEGARQDMVAMVSAPGYLGPTIYFNMAEPSSVRETRTLHHAVTD